MNAPAWASLEGHWQTLHAVHLRQLFAEDSTRGERLAAEAVGVYLDYSKNRVSNETLTLLLRLAEEAGLRARIDAMFSGDRINVSEQRAVLHVALRAPRGSTVLVDGRNVVPAVNEVLDKMAAFANRLRGGDWQGHTGIRIRNAICWKLKAGSDPGFSLYDLADRLRTRGWQVPAYALPVAMESQVVQRVLVRHAVSQDLCSLLMDDIRNAIAYFDRYTIQVSMDALEATGFHH